jgi:hypothetical protein
MGPPAQTAVQTPPQAKIMFQSTGPSANQVAKAQVAPVQVSRAESKESSEFASALTNALSLVLGAVSNNQTSSSRPPNLPGWQHLRKYEGEKGLPAQSWLSDIEQLRKIYSISDAQIVPMAKVACTGKAKEWAEIQCMEQTWEQFKARFLREWGERNQEKLCWKMVTHMQDESSVGEYATTMQRYFYQLDLDPQQQMKNFIKNFQTPRIREYVFSRSPPTLKAAIEAARDAEDMYISVVEQKEPGQRVTALERQVEILTHQSKTAKPPDRPVWRGRCPKCLEEGHRWNDCKYEPKTEQCKKCYFWGRHRYNCTENKETAQNPASNYLKVEFDSNEAESNIAPPAEMYACEDDSVTDSESEYSSSEDSGSSEEKEYVLENGEVFAVKREREENRGSFEKRQKRDRNELPRKREPMKPVVNPLTEEQKAQRRATVSDS